MAPPTPARPRPRTVWAGHSPDNLLADIACRLAAAEAEFRDTAGMAPATVAFFNLPLAGHVNPTLPLIAELSRRGVRTLAYLPPEFREQLEAAGAEMREYSGRIRYDYHNPDSNLIKGGVALTEATEDLLPFALDEIRRESPDVVIHDSMCPWGRLAARKFDVPTISSTSTLAFHSAMLRARSSLADVTLTVAGGALAYPRLRRARARVRRRHGLDPGTMVDLFSNRADRAIVFTSRAFQPRTELFDDSVHFVGPLLRSEHHTDEALFAELGEEPLVYVSLGTLFNARPDFFRACLEAFAGSHFRLLLSIGDKLDPDALGPLPANAVVRRSVPQLAVLSRARLFITHGGMNSVSEALWFGVPLVAFPQQAEQALVARRVQEVGAGRILRGRSPGAGAIRASCEAVLVGDCAAVAAELGRSFRDAGGVSRAADVVGDLLETGSSRLKPEAPTSGEAIWQKPGSGRDTAAWPQERP